MAPGSSTWNFPPMSAMLLRKASREVVAVVILTLVSRTVLPQITDGSEPSLPKWLASTGIHSQIAQIFDRIDNVDIVLDDRTLFEHQDLLDHLVRWLREKSVRIYLVASIANEANRDGCMVGVYDRDYGDDIEAIRLDHAHESFAKNWQQNEHDGYLFLGNLSTFETLEECLIDPLGTYLLLLDEKRDEQVGLKQVFSLLRDIWERKGAYRVFAMLDEQIYWYNPFANEGVGYGALKELKEPDHPSIPRNDFKGYPLRIEMFWSTYSVPMNEKVPYVNFLGPDAEVSRALAGSLNFTPLYIRPDGDTFGSRLPNGSFNGVIGRLARRESDVAFVGFFVKDYFSRDIEFTTGIYDDELCCLVKKASRIPEYLLPITIFPSDLWGVLFLSGIVFSIIWTAIRAIIRLIGRASGTRHENQRLAQLFNLSNETRDAPMYRKVLRILVDTYIIWVSAPFRRFTRSSVERFMLFGMMLVSLIFISMFQSSLASIFLNPVYYKDIDTLEQLDKSGIKIEVKYRGFMDDVFPANNSPTMDSLRSKMVYQPIKSSMPERVAHLPTPISTVTRKTTLSLDNSIYLSTNQLHMVRECPRTYNLAYVTSRHSVFLERINEVISRLFNGGLINHWISEINFNTTIRDWEQIRNSQDANFKILTLVDMQFPFYLLIIGIGASTMIFIVEHVHFRIRKSRKVNSVNAHSFGRISFGSN